MSDDVHLLDANVLIALVVAEHEFHDRASSWVSTVGRVAVCPITEGAVARFLLRVGESSQTVAALLSALRDRCEFWPDAVSYADMDFSGIRGHRHVTDAYLAALARSRGAKLATFDEALAAAHRDVVIGIA